VGGWMVEQVEGVQAADVAALLDGERDAPPAST
jgi:hypothetical protein